MSRENDKNVNFEDPPNYYQILGLSNNADIHAIATAYRKLAFQYHPDTNISFDKNDHYGSLAVAFFKDEKKRNPTGVIAMLNAVSEVLEDEDKKAAYDRAILPLPPVHSQSTPNEEKGNVNQNSAKPKGTTKFNINKFISKSGKDSETNIDHRDLSGIKKSFSSKKFQFDFHSTKEDYTKKSGRGFSK